MVLYLLASGNEILCYVAANGGFSDGEGQPGAKRRRLDGADLPVDATKAARPTTDGSDAHGQNANGERDGLGQGPETDYNRNEPVEEPVIAPGRRPRPFHDLDPAHHPVFVSTRPRCTRRVPMGGTGGACLACKGMRVSSTLSDSVTGHANQLCACRDVSELKGVLLEILILTYLTR